MRILDGIELEIAGEPSLELSVYGVGVKLAIRDSSDREHFRRISMWVDARTAARLERAVNAFNREIAGTNLQEAAE